MELNQKSIEIIERIVYKNTDDLAVSFSRTCERLEERLDALESRLSARTGDVEDKLETVRQDIIDEVSEVNRNIDDFKGIVRKEVIKKA